MSLKNVDNILYEYRTLVDEVIDSFYIPCLKEAVEYKRAVGFFSSGVLLQISEGLGAIAKKKGKIKLIVSPRLDKNDYEAIKNGYEIREFVTNRIIEDFDESIDFEQKEDRFSLLSYLISENLLDIKVAFLEEYSSKRAMYHAKLGVMVDDDDNMVAFSGSANESGLAYNDNYELIDTYCSWKSESDSERCELKNYRFDSMWNDNEKGLITIPFPTVVKEKLLKYKNYDIDFEQLDVDLKKLRIQKFFKPETPNVENVNLFDYQEEAIDNWEKNNFHGIFDMATGTGKTFTACGAIVRLFEKKKRIVVVICCPYTHLVDQWCEEVEKFNITPVKCYGASAAYYDKLKRCCRDFKTKRSDFVCIIISNSSFQIERNQELISMNLDHTLLIADEAHNFGANNISKMLEVNYPYRLALSATLDRCGDEFGTKKLYDFFDKKCIVYDLARAIQENKLTRYYYHPILVNLSEHELDKYYELTKKIKKFHFNNETEMPKALKNLLIARSRVIAGANNKVYKFLELMEDYKNQSNLIVYCGAVKFGEAEYIASEEDKRQIEEITTRLNKDLNVVATKFTSEEDSEMRKNIIQAYKNEEIQALVAIKCLDEGMNIPAIKTAFILASSSNPKEYIQRRGRVLRKAEGKEFAEIYDFITIPRPLETVHSTPEVFKEMDVSLVKKELLRMVDFANLSNNPSESNRLINEIKNAYSMDVIKEGDIYEYE